MTDPALEIIMLRERPQCQFPNEKGVPDCNRPTAAILTLRSQWTIAVCLECAQYVAKEQKKHLVKRD